MKVYFDNAASTPLYPEVIDCINNAMLHVFGNPSSIHSKGREAKVLIEKARNVIANIIGANPSEIIFTSGGTEAVNTLLNGFVKSLGVKNIITSPIEHPAVLNTLKSISHNNDVTIHFLHLNNKGSINLQEIDELLNANTDALVCLMNVNNEIGIINPVREIAEIAKQHKAYFISDTVQSLGKIDVNVKDVKFDAIVCSAHKFHGPKGIGFIYIRKPIVIESFLKGGSQENNMRAGTENTYLIAGLAKALEKSNENREKKIFYIQGIKEYFYNNLKFYFSDLIFFSDITSEYTPTILNVAFPLNEKSEMLFYNLDIQGICVSAGSACNSGNVKKSYVISNLTKDENYINIRFSFSRFNTKKEVDYCLMVLKNELSDKK